MRRALGAPALTKPFSSLHGVSGAIGTSRTRVIRRITLRKRMQARMLRYATVAQSPRRVTRWSAQDKREATIAAVCGTFLVADLAWLVTSFF